jgi:type III pantothenate kinase
MISFPVDTFSVEDLDRLLLDHTNIHGAILSSVKDNQEELIGALKKRLSFFVELSHNTPLPILNDYQSPETLGKDRIAAAVGAYYLFRHENVLIIDAGTAVTYDLVDKTGHYKGGFITPGLRMRFNALNYFTDKLPLLEPAAPSEIEGTNTSNSINGGVQYGLQGEAMNIINFFTEKYGELIIVLTGGDSSYFEKIVKNPKLVNHEITLLGLNAILEFNTTQKA